jgi:gamma-glutamyltranspeptidase/glutathione hydrolase/leukotriene-C4 hydrolase
LQARTFPPEYYGSSFDIEDTPGTTHLSVVDKDRMAVALTSTVFIFKFFFRHVLVYLSKVSDFLWIIGSRPTIAWAG